MQTKTITIINKLGLHARAAASLVQTVSGFECETNISYNGKKVNGKSIMGVMMLAAAKGAVIEVSTAGPDEQEAMAKIEALIQDKFGEDE